VRRFYVAGFLVLLAFDTIAQIGFKLAANSAAPPEFGVAWIERIATERWIYLAILGYLGAFGTWMTLLRYAPVGPAFATSHLDIVSVLCVSVLLLGERLSRPQALGAALILTGIGLLAATPRGRAGDSDTA
jgi:multidrug transporter EmrE-like cation transporter